MIFAQCSEQVVRNILVKDSYDRGRAERKVIKSGVGCKIEYKKTSLCFSSCCMSSSGNAKSKWETELFGSFARPTLHRKCSITSRTRARKKCIILLVSYETDNVTH